jgi:hypothetical protein
MGGVRVEGKVRGFDRAAKPGAVPRANVAKEGLLRRKKIVGKLPPKVKPS